MDCMGRGAHQPLSDQERIEMDFFLRMAAETTANSAVPDSGTRDESSPSEFQSDFIHPSVIRHGLSKDHQTKAECRDEHWTYIPVQWIGQKQARASEHDHHGQKHPFSRFREHGTQQQIGPPPGKSREERKD